MASLALVAFSFQYSTANEVDRIGPYACVFRSGSGSHTIKIFFADQHSAGSSLSFFDDAVPVTAAPAVPEPSSLALLGTGMFAIGGMVRRRFTR